MFRIGAFEHKKRKKPVSLATRAEQYRAERILLLNGYKKSCDFGEEG